MKKTVKVEAGLHKKAKVQAELLGETLEAFTDTALRSLIKFVSGPKDAAKRRYRLTPEEAEKIIGKELAKAEQAAKRRTKEK